MQTKNKFKNETSQRDEIQMQLWTVINGDIYLEEGNAVAERYELVDGEAKNVINKYHISQTKNMKNQIT